MDSKAFDYIRRIDALKAYDKDEHKFQENLQEIESKEIVFCKDCMLNTVNTDGATEPWCYKFGYAVEDTDFCSYGEEK